MATENCQHHWMIEPPEGPESRAECTNCGSQRTFSNASPFQYDREGGNMRMDRELRASVRTSHREQIALSDETA